MSKSRKKTITVATTKELTSESYYRRLWIASKNPPVYISRRDWLDEIANAFRDYEGEILNPSGLPYKIPFVDDVFNDDFDMRWMGYYCKCDGSGQSPKSRSRKVQRLQLLDLYFKIRYPDISRHFSK